MLRTRILTGLLLSAATLVSVACEDEKPPARPSEGDDDADDDADDDDDDKGSGSCTIPKSCDDVDVPLFRYEVCCTEKVTCGFDMTPATLAYDTLEAAGQIEELFPPGFDKKQPCVAKSAIFVRSPTPTVEETVEVEEGEEPIVLSSKCKTINFSGFTLPGCCLESGACGVSTHINQATFNSYADDAEATFVKPECLDHEAFNERMRASQLSPMGHLTKISGSCE